MEQIHPGVFKDGKNVATKAIAFGNVYGEEIKDGYRIWNPFRSKLAAAILNGMKTFPFKENSSVLYLGAATGTTPSHVSDIVKNGHVYAVEFSETSMRKLFELGKRRKNLTPLLQDARKPADYQYLVSDIDIIYQDVAQPDQSNILIKNAEVFLKPGDYALLCVKARSIDMAMDPDKVFEKEKATLSKAFEIVEEIKLEPYDKDHRFFVLKKS